MLLSATRLRSSSVLLAATLIIALAAAQPALADDVPATQPAATSTEPAASHDVHASIDEAIAHQRSRRGWAIAGMVAGSAVILGGSIAGAASNSDYGMCNNGCQGDHHNGTGYYIAAGLGLPLLGYSIYLFSDAQHQINQLNTSRVGLGYSPDSHQPMLQASIGF